LRILISSMTAGTVLLYAVLPSHQTSTGATMAAPAPRPARPSPERCFPGDLAATRPLLPFPEPTEKPVLPYSKGHPPTVPPRSVKPVSGGSRHRATLAPRHAAAPPSPRPKPGQFLPHRFGGEPPDRFLDLLLGVVVVQRVSPRGMVRPHLSASPPDSNRNSSARNRNAPPVHPN
jgi:hypothetical protein